MKKTLLTLVTCMSSAWASAEAGLKLGNPVYGGTGCPQGSAVAVLSPEQDTLSILFDSYFAEAGGDSRKRVDRKTCQLRVPIQVPQGYSISILQADYRGYTDLPAGASATLGASYYFAGSNQTARISKRFNGPVARDYTHTHRLGVEALVWSACGASTNLAINSDMTVTTNRFMEQALATVDSIDLSSAMIYHIQWKRCF